MVICGITNVEYLRLSANFYPHPGTLIPAAAILGCSGCVLWASARVYIGDLAKAYGTEMALGIEQTTSHFFGIFTATTMASLLVGNTISSMVLHNASKSKAAHMTVPCAPGTTCANSSSTITSPYITDQPYSATYVYNSCGIHNCDINYGTKRERTGNPSTPDFESTAIYALFGAFATSQVIAAMLIFCGINDERTNMEKGQGLPLDEKSEQVKMTAQEPSCDVSLLHTAKGHPSNSSKRIKAQIIATGKLLLTNHHAKALIPIACHVGALKVFAYGQFTRHWISCYMGESFHNIL